MRVMDSGRAPGRLAAVALGAHQLLADSAGESHQIQPPDGGVGLDAPLMHLWGMLNIVGVPDPDGSPRLQSFGYATTPLDEELA